MWKINLLNKKTKLRSDRFVKRLGCVFFNYIRKHWNNFVHHTFCFLSDEIRNRVRGEQNGTLGSGNFKFSQKLLTLFPEKRKGGGRNKSSGNGYA